MNWVRRIKGSKQHFANTLQIVGSVGLTVGAGLVNVIAGVFVGSALMIVAGVVVAS